MEKESELVKPGKSSPGKSSGSFITSVSYACLMFVLVVSFHQILLYILSIKMGYRTSISFVKIDSRPYDVDHWSNNRVILLYALPPGLLLLSAILLLSRMMLYTQKKIDQLFVATFWWSVCSILYVSSQMTVSIIAYALDRDELYQGIPVLIMWFGIPFGLTFVLTIITTIVNLLLGFAFFQLVMQFSVYRTDALNSSKRDQTIKKHYLYPILILMPLGAFLSFPKMPFFFFAFLINAMLWIPGLYIAGHMGRAAETRSEKNEIKPMKTIGILIIAAIIVVIRIAFWVMK